jgi:hypothetical protein
MAPRDGSGIYSQPHDDVDQDTTIESAVYNAFTRDVEADLNAARPIIAGGSGATSVNGALQNLQAEKAAQLVTDYNTHLWMPGSFRSVGDTPGAPVADHDFCGVCIINEPVVAAPGAPTNQNLVLEARDEDDTVVPGKVYVREKKAGTWSAWVAEGSIYALTTDVVEPLRKDGGLTPHDNLKILCNAGSTIALTADGLLLFNAAGKPKKLTSWNAGCSLAIGVGVGGLDAGSRVASTWYHIWAIAKADGTKGLIFSTSASAPTLPTDYLFYGYVGAAYNNASNVLHRFNQRNNHVRGHHADIGTMVAGGNATNYTAVSLSAAIPNTAAAVHLIVANGTSAVTGVMSSWFAGAGSSVTATYDETYHSSQHYSADTGRVYAHIEVPIVTAQQIMYRISSAVAAFINLQVAGWRY